MTSAMTEHASAIDLRCGRYQDTLGDVTCDVLITDAPYSNRTHAAYSPTTSVLIARADPRRPGRTVAWDQKWAATGGVRRQIEFECWTAADVDAFVDAWSPRVRGWLVTITDDVLAPVWQRALDRAGRYAFAPLPFVAPGSRVRLTGDGPSSWSCWVVVARPRSPTFVRWGTLPGAYVLPGKAEPMIVCGGKPLWLMRALVRDYSRPGDLVCDPCAGGATTLLAAAIEGRRAVGSEMDIATHAKATARLARGYTPSFDFGSP